MNIIWMVMLLLPGLLLNHRRISLENVKMDRVAFNYRLWVGKDYIAIDSSSVLTYNKLLLNPYMLYRRGGAKQLT